MPEMAPRIKIHDDLGVELAVIGEGTLLKLFSGFQNLLLGLRDGSLLELLKNPQQLLSGIELDEVSAGLHFDEKLNFLELGENFLLEYFIDSGAQGRLILKKAGSRLNGRIVEEGRLYSVLQLSAFLDAGVSAPIPLGTGVTVSPGLRGGASFEVSHYQPHPETRPVLDVVEKAVGGLRFPFNPQAVSDLAEGEAISMRWDGTLAWSVSLSWGLRSGLLLDEVKQLNKLHPDLKRAEVLGADLGVDVPVAAQTKVEVVNGVTDEFDFKVEGAGVNRVRLEISKTKSKFTNVGFDFTAGLVEALTPAIRQELNSFLGERFSGAISGPALQLTDRLIAAAEDALTKRARITFSSLYRKVDRGGALFRMEFDLASAESRSAYSRAIEGDLTVALAMAEKAGSGVSVLSTVHEALGQQSLELRLNLIGLFKFESFEELSRKSIIEVDDAGEVSIYHASSFKARSKTSLGHLKMADFLFKAAWQRGHLVAGERDFDLSLHYSFLEEDRFTSRAELLETLALAVALGLMTEGEKQEILSVPVEFRRALSWPVLDVFSPEATYGKSRVTVESAFDEAALDSILGQEEAVVWSAFTVAYPLANPRSQATDWLDAGVRARIDREGWAAYVNTTDSRLRRHRQAVVTEYAKARQFVKTLRIFRMAVQSGARGEQLAEKLNRAGKVARDFHFDRTAFLALNLLCRPDQRKTRLRIRGDKINGDFPVNDST